MIEILNGIRETIVYDENMSLRLHLNDVDEDYPLHWQTAIEILLPIENIYTVKIENNTIILKTGDILIISPGVLHELFTPGAGSRYILLFDPPLFSNIIGMDSLHSMFYPYVLFNDETGKEVKDSMKGIMDQIYGEYISGHELKYAAIYAYLLEFLVIAGRHKTNQPILLLNLKTGKAHKYVNKFKEICTYIEEHCTEDLGIAGLAELSKFSESHFIRLFKQFTNMSCYEYLNMSRINYAKKLLASQPELTIVEISMRSGFGSLATFNRLFKAATRCTPTQYRNLRG